MTRSQRITDGLRLWTAACALALVVLLFRQPLSEQIVPRVVGALGGVQAGRPAPGFVVRITSTPPSRGAVWIDGVERGTVPFFGNVRCRDGDPARIELRADGFRPWTRTVTCRDGGSLEAHARLDVAESR